MKCNNCKRKDYCEAHSIENDSCVASGYSDYVPQTNADRIRAMTNVELAKYHAKLIGCPKNVVDYRGCSAAKECKASACWLGWLREEGE